jgi:fructokinase
VDILTPLLEACDHCPFLLDTDVNAPAALEFAMANHHTNDNARSIIKPTMTSTTIYSSPTTTATTTAATEKKKKKSITSCAYVTVGTGVGVGLVVNSQTVRGFLHPEGGHVPVPPLPGDTFGGYSWGKGSVLPFGGVNTVEALASSVALVERYEQELAKIGALNATNNLKSRGELANVPDESDIWDHAVNAIATLCTTMILLLSVERIVLGGGVLQRGMLLGKIRIRTTELLNHYLPLDGPEDDALRLDQMIVVSAHGKDAG